MRLELGSFSVDDVVLGSQTRWHDNVLEVSRQELLDLVLEDEHISSASIDLDTSMHTMIWEPTRDVCTRCSPP